MISMDIGRGTEHKVEKENLTHGFHRASDAGKQF